MFKIRVISERLTDGSRVFNVLMSNDDGTTLEFHAYGHEQALNLASEFVDSVNHYTCEVAGVVDLAGAEP